MQLHPYNYVRDKLVSPKDTMPTLLTIDNCVSRGKPVHTYNLS